MWSEIDMQVQETGIYTPGTRRISSNLQAPPQQTVSPLTALLPVPNAGHLSGSLELPVLASPNRSTFGFVGISWWM